MKDKNKIYFTEKEIKEMYKGILPRYKWKTLEVRK